MQLNINDTMMPNISERDAGTKPLFEFSEILEDFGLTYKNIDFYYQVGEITVVQGWMLDLSVIAIQFEDLLRTILPVLIWEKTPFKIAKDMDLARSLLNGKLGYVELGKLVTIYPSGDEQAKNIADELIAMTRGFRGPRILTDRHLGSVVYARYGGCAPVLQANQRGIQEKFIYDDKGNLVKDEYSIPFAMQQWVIWPFGDIVPAIAPKEETVLQDKYRGMTMLKEDAKGNVKKALWLKNYLYIKWCLIKEGKKDMIADENGRDICDRLRWQHELHTALQGTVPVPKVHDFFEENGNTYLVMDYIKGTPLDTVISSTFRQQTWWELKVADRLRLLGYATQILHIIENMHANGYIHRDITPVNFLVTNDDSLWMIDLELCYSEMAQKPFPPFQFGTSWFMSPEQQEVKRPTVYEDIYAIGATLVVLLTNLFPGKFALAHQGTLRDQLYFFIQDKRLVEIICRCFSEEPKQRPSLSAIQDSLKKFIEKQMAPREYAYNIPAINETFKSRISDIIRNGIKGMVNPSMFSDEKLWWSKTKQDEMFAYYQMDSCSVYFGFDVGLSGILFVLSRAHKMGYSIRPCMEGYVTSCEFIRKKYMPQLSMDYGGLYAGSAGIAFAFAEVIESNLISEQRLMIHELTQLLENERLDGLGVAKGISGQGMALLRCAGHLEKNFLEQHLENNLNHLFSEQQRDGSWLNFIENQKPLKLTGFGHGIAGLTCFLVGCLATGYEDPRIEQSVHQALKWLTLQKRQRNGQIKWYIHNKSKENVLGFHEGHAGIALAYLKAYELFGDVTYRKLAEDTLRSYPLCMTDRNLSLSDGLAGIGELYLEAARILNDEEWQTRADWIAQLLLHHFQQGDDGSCSWLVDDSAFSTADLMNGTSGLIHFLIRYDKPGMLTHPLLTV